MQKLLVLLALTIAGKFFWKRTISFLKYSWTDSKQKSDVLLFNSTVYCVCECQANRLDDIEEALESEEADAFFDSADADEFDKRDKSYLTAPK